MTYYEKNKEKMKEYSKKYREENKERISQRGKEYYQKNKEKIQAYQKSRRGERKPKRLDNYISININGKIGEHRYLWEQANGPIPKGYIIHHINGDVQDNRLENLLCLTPKEHKRLHKEEQIKSTGSDYYGKRCKNWVDNNREKWNKYQNEYKKTHKYTTSKEVSKNYYEKNKEKCIQKSLNYYYQHKETINKKAMERYYKNKEKQNEG